MSSVPWGKSAFVGLTYTSYFDILSQNMQNHKASRIRNNISAPCKMRASRRGVGCGPGVRPTRKINRHWAATLLPSQQPQPHAERPRLPMTVGQELGRAL